MPVHIAAYFENFSVTVTEMTNAGKRGKTCRQLSVHVSGWNSDVAFQNCCKLVRHLGLDYNACGRRIEQMFESVAFDEMVAFMQQLPELTTRQDDIKGVDAPVPPKTFANEKFSIHIDKHGVGMSDLTDPINMPRTITSRQKGPEAYRKAFKVWDQIVQCVNSHQAYNVLAAAGCKLHSYCAMD